MNRFTYLSLLSLCILFSCTNSEKQSQRDDDTSNVTTEKVNNLPNHFYKRLEGTIAGKEVVVEFNKTNSIAVGSYYYTDSGRSISLMLDTVINQDSLVLHEYILGEQSEKDAKLYLKWTGNGFSGTFENKLGKSSPIELKENYPNWSYRFQPDSLVASQKAFPDREVSPKGSISAQYLVYSGKNAAWVNNTIKTAFGLKNNQEWNAGLKSDFAKYFADYKNDVAEMAKDIKPGENAYFLNYESSQTVSVKFNEKDFVVIEMMNYSYTGGAHGNYGSSFYNLDIAAQKILKLNDILKADSITLNKIGETYFRKQFNLKPKEALTSILFDNYLKLNDNFYINSKGISFLYNPYEIASYAQGQIDVFIPFDALKPYLTGSFKERMGIK